MKSISVVVSGAKPGARRFSIDAMAERHLRKSAILRRSEADRPVADLYPPQVLPRLRVVHTVNAGDVYGLSNLHLAASTLNLNAESLAYPLPATPAVAMLDNVVIDAGSTVSMIGTWTCQPVLELNGSTVNNGLIDIQTGGSTVGTRTGMTEAQITIGKRSSFTSNGTITEHAGNNAYSSLSVVGGGPNATFVNNGVVNDWNTTIDTALLGHGTFAFLPPALTPMSWETGRVEVDESVGSGVVFNFANDGALTIGDLRDFHGTLQGFSGAHATSAPVGSTQDVLTILNFSVTQVSFAGDASGGALTLDAGNSVVGSIHLTGGDYRHAAFSILQAQGTNGVESIIRLA